LCLGVVVVFVDFTQLFDLLMPQMEAVIERSIAEIGILREQTRRSSDENERLREEMKHIESLRGKVDNLAQALALRDKTIHDLNSKSSDSKKQAQVSTVRPGIT
jgi:hypothetical protein